MRRLWLAAGAASLLVLLPLGCVEITYQLALRQLPRLPDRPAPYPLGPELKKVVWAHWDGTKEPQMVPLGSGKLVVWIGKSLMGKPSLLPGFNIAGTVAKLHLDRLIGDGVIRKDSLGQLSGLALIVWVTRNYSADDAIFAWATAAPGPRGTTGLRSSADVLYGKSPDDLGVAQVALLIGVSWAPERNDLGVIQIRLVALAIKRSLISPALVSSRPWG